MPNYNKSFSFKCPNSETISLFRGGSFIHWTPDGEAGDGTNKNQ